MFVPKFLVVLLALLLGSVVAAPTYYERSSDVELDAREPLSRFQQAVHAIRIKNQISQRLHPQAGEAVFWSGATLNARGRAVSARKHADKFIRNHPGTSTINSALARNGIRIPNTSQNKYSDHIWAHASKVWADRAHGEAHVILGANTRPNSVYNTIEKPALMANQGVHRVTEHHVGGGDHVVKGHP